MRKTFEKYFITLVFILIGGVLLLRANFVDDKQDPSLSHYCEVLPHTTSTAQILPFSPDFHFNLGQIVLEEIDLDEYDHNLEGSSVNPDLHYLGLAAFIFDFYLENQERHLAIHSALEDSSQLLPHSHCKRYIQLEVFRI